MIKRITMLSLSILTFICCYPIIFIIVGSFMAGEELQNNLEAILENSSGYISWSLLPYNPTLQSYIEIMLDTPEFFVVFWNSVKISIGVLIGQSIIAVPAAWGFARFYFPLHKKLLYIYIILMMMPFQVLMLPNYLILNQFGLINTLWSIILPGTFSTFSIFIMYNSFCKIPEAIIDAARIDGAGEIRIFIYIGIPLGKTGIISAGVLVFLEYWNLIEQPMTFLNNKALWPLSLFLPDIRSDTLGVTFASSVITSIPTLFVYFLGEEYLEQGISAFISKQ